MKLNENGGNKKARAWGGAIVPWGFRGKEGSGAAVGQSAQFKRAYNSAKEELTVAIRK